MKEKVDTFFCKDNEVVMDLFKRNRFYLKNVVILTISVELYNIYYQHGIMSKKINMLICLETL